MSLEETCQWGSAGTAGPLRQRRKKSRDQCRIPVRLDLAQSNGWAANHQGAVVRRRQGPRWAVLPGAGARHDEQRLDRVRRWLPGRHQPRRPTPPARPSSRRRIKINTSIGYAPEPPHVEQPLPAGQIPTAPPSARAVKIDVEHIASQNVAGSCRSVVNIDSWVSGSHVSGRSVRNASPTASPIDPLTAAGRPPGAPPGRSGRPATPRR